MKRLTFLSGIVIFKVAVKRNVLKLFSLKRQMNVKFAVNRDFKYVIDIFNTRSPVLEPILFFRKL